MAALRIGPMYARQHLNGPLAWRLIKHPPSTHGARADMVIAERRS